MKPVLPVAEANKIVEVLFDAHHWIYWSDFLLHVALGWTAFVLTVLSPDFSWTQSVSYLVSGFCLYRSVIFIHELTHLKKNTFGFFRIVWNLLCGFPLMVPSFVYMGVHIDHHKQKMYGTSEDGEYFPFVLKGRFRIVLFLIQMIVAPVIIALRFLVLTPVSYLIPPLRKLLWAYASSLVIDSEWKRPEPQERDGKWWQLQELMTFVYAAVFAGLLVTGILPLKALAVWYGVAAMILFVNGLRTLVAHCYRNPSDHVLEFSEQYLDSINVPGNPLTTPLWAPVGLRYHATHHLFPGMPYHNLGEAHRRLMKELPDNSLYRTTMRNSLWDGLVRLWKEA